MDGGGADSGITAGAATAGRGVGRAGMGSSPLIAQATKTITIPRPNTTNPAGINWNQAGRESHSSIESIMRLASAWPGSRCKSNRQSRWARV